MTTLDKLASRRGVLVRRGRANPEKIWLIDGSGRLLTEPRGTDEDGALKVLAGLATRT